MSYESYLCSTPVHPTEMKPEHRQRYYNEQNPFSKDKRCETCIKSDVCTLQAELNKAIEDIANIENRTNVFIDTKITCKKYAAKHIIGSRYY